MIGICPRLHAWYWRVCGWPCIVLAFLLCSGAAQGRLGAQAPASPHDTGSGTTLLLPSSVAYDAAGDLFFVDTDRNQVFEVSLAGTLSLVAGTGEQGFAGDGGSAGSALLNSPQGIAVGPDGTVYVADTGNQRVRAIAMAQIATVAGNGTRGFSGDHAAAVSAMLNAPVALAVDASGGLLICDRDNQRVRRVAAGVIETVVGDGVQGFAGDGASATAAELDSPSGVAVASDGRIFLADSRNHRVRVVGTDGVIQTFAGEGTRGFSGDGGPANAAELFLPRGVAVMHDGSVIFADSNNQRVRSVSASGVISTIAGAGWQGSAADGTAATAAPLNAPRGVAVSSFGAPVFADSPNRMVREVAVNGELYTIAVPSQPRVSSVMLQAPSASVYGQGSAAIQVTGALAPQGAVMLLDGTSVVAAGALAGGAVTISTASLSAGSHALSAAFAGDGINPAATSSVTAMTVAPANAVATADASTISYGQAVPPLTGEISGVLAQDASLVSVAFATSAGPLSPAGSYPIYAALSGQAAANYSLSLSPASGVLQIVRAASSVQMQTQQQGSYAGLPLVLTANLRSLTSGTPGGEVDFFDGATMIANGAASNGVASGTYLAPAAGSHTLSASYAGDGNFVGSVSAPVVVSVAAVPDFSLATPADQTVQAGLIASYALSVTPQGGPFTGSVAFSVAGLPAGATASFSPTFVVPGATGATVTMNVQTSATAALDWPGQKPRANAVLWCLVFPCVWIGARRKWLRRARTLLCVASGALLTTMLGCGARTAATAAQVSHSYALTVTATSTNLVGSIVTHSTAVTLTIE